jgi:hypothetical protein
MSMFSMEILIPVQEIDISIFDLNQLKVSDFITASKNGHTTIVSKFVNSEFKTVCGKFIHILCKIKGYSCFRPTAIKFWISRNCIKPKNN